MAHFYPISQEVPLRAKQSIPILMAESTLVRCFGERDFLMNSSAVLLQMTLCNETSAVNRLVLKHPCTFVVDSAPRDHCSLSLLSMNYPIEGLHVAG